MRLRIRSSTGTSTLAVQPTWTLADLKHHLNASSLRTGYPPKPVSASDTQQVTSLFSDGDVVVVATAAAAAAAAAAATTAAADASLSSVPSSISSSSSSAGAAARRRPAAVAAAPPRMRVCVVPDDNSCLFRSVNALLSRPPTAAAVHALRAEVRDVVARGGALYNEAFLGRPNAAYCAWIMSDAAWGGAIELSILAHRFSVELAAFDVKTMRLDRYGEGNGYACVGFLVYDGIHYNYVAAERGGGGGGGSGGETLFKVGDEGALSGARALAQQQHDANKFTDTATFTLRCGQCGTRMRGEAEAVQHANATGHTQFTEK